jgi:alkylhydroperoxidase family enzyme
MPDLPLLSGPADDERLRAVHDRVHAGIGRWPNLYAMLANAPALLDAWVEFAWALRSVPESDRRLRELAIMRVAQLTGSEYEWQAHWFMATDAGVPAEALTALGRWRESPLYSEDEQVVLEAADILTDTGELTEGVRRRLLARLGEQQTVEVVLTIAFYSCVRRVLGGLGVPPDERGESAPGLASLPGQD